MTASNLELVVRNAEPRDEHAVRALLIAFGYPEDSLSHIRGRIEPSDSSPFVLVAERDGEVVGVGGLSLSIVLERVNPQARITVLVIAESEQGHGTGRALVHAFEHKALELGCTRLELTSSHRLPGAHAFWRALGFEETGLRFAKVLRDEAAWQPPA